VVELIGQHGIDEKKTNGREIQLFELKNHCDY
jgi:hypothetical protein